MMIVLPTHTPPPTTYRRYADAAAQLPQGALWSSSFGYAGESGFTEFWRLPDGSRYVISNGSNEATRMEFKCQRFDDWYPYPQGVNTAALA